MKLSKTLALIVVAGAASLAQATFSYGNFVGTDVTFTNVTEDSSTHPSTALFGAPTAIVNSLAFSPTSFGISSSGGGVNFMDGTLIFGVNANPGKVIQQVRFSEAGDYSLIGSGGASTFAWVNAAVFVRVTEVNGVAINPIQVNGNLSFTPSGGTFDLASDGPAIARIWNGSLIVDIDAFLLSQGIAGSATKALVSLDNTLAVGSEVGSSAFIKKKQNGVTVDIVTPTPGTAALLGLGVVAAGRRRR